MVRLATWLLVAVLLFSAAPAAAQSSPDAPPAADEESMEVVPEMEPAPAEQGPPVEQAAPVEQPAPALPARTDFPYGVLVAELSNAPRAHEAGFRVMATTVSWRRTQPTRGQYPFEQTDQFGRTAANDVTNIIDAARNN